MITFQGTGGLNNMLPLCQITNEQNFFANEWICVCNKMQILQSLDFTCLCP